MVVRPSGTEPKLKCYLQVVVPEVTAQTLATAKAQARQRLAAIKTDLREVLGFDAP